ncbi:MAG: hypothetical protein ACO1SV_18450 [Fimbriimonas sp.]
MKKFAWVLLPLGLLVGCGQGGEKVDPKPEGTMAVPEKKPAGEVTTLEGPSGKVSLGDSVEQAKKAFPAPKEAKTFDNPMSFGTIAKEGWAWSIDAKAEAFEVGTQDGKIVAMGRIDGSKDVLEKSVPKIGEPTRRVDGKAMSVYVWDAGENVRFVMDVKKSMGMMPQGAMVMIGKAADLKRMNFQPDDPGLVVKQVDQAMEQMNSPEYKKAIEEAKLRAQEKK